MNVAKVQKLSKQHEALKGFLEKCRQIDVELSVKQSAFIYEEETLDYLTTALIIGKVRKALSEEIAEIEKLIKEEAAK